MVRLAALIRGQPEAIQDQIRAAFQRRVQPYVEPAGSGFRYRSRSRAGSSERAREPMTDVSTRPVALITGGRRGIGQGIAFALADAGFDLVINDLERDADAEATLAGISERGASASFVAADVADLAAHPGLVDAASWPSAVSTAWSTTPASRC